MDNNRTAEVFANEYFKQYFEDIQSRIHTNAVAHGWWDEPREDGTLIALIMSEAAEALEALRKGNGPDEHCPQFSGAEVELADVVIRIMDMAEARGWNVAGPSWRSMSSTRQGRTSTARNFNDTAAH